MASILCVETATEVCSIAISVDGKVVFEKENREGPSHATQLGVFAEEALAWARTNDLVLDAIAVSCGPGSYTGLRIGVSEAKGLCFGLNLPLIAVGTLELLANGVVKRKLVSDGVLLCPMIDARRMEVYDGIFNKELDIVRHVNADIIDETSFACFLNTQQVAFFGNGAAKCKDTLQHTNAIFIDDIYPKASDMVELADAAFSAGDFEDVAYFEPFYLKEFVATIAKNKVLPVK